ncbi:MAG: hypothetical protein HDR88_05435 [Bacteroides sp.]|nr:hypothetical protein [Bacteroides sp.]
MRQLIALYLVSIVGYLSTIIILKKYNTLNYFLDSFIIVGLINCSITILQYFGIGISYVIGGIFVDLNDPVKVAQLTRIMDGDHSNLMGIMGDIVYNGYYSMILPFILLIRLKNKNSIVQIISVLISLISLFMVGERSCFGITLLLLSLYIYREYRKTILFKITCVGIFISLLFFISDFIGSDIIQESRWVGEKSTVRDDINSAILPFIFSHLLFGGLASFIKLTHFPPHNVIASGFIYAGIIGGSCIIYILFRQAEITYRLIKRHQNMLISLAFAAYTLNGLFHNPAIVTGDAMVWILWGMVIYSYKTYRYKITCQLKTIH